VLRAAVYITTHGSTLFGDKQDIRALHQRFLCVGELTEALLPGTDARRAGRRDLYESNGRK
jgi:hypothetical protein